jgi:outer membrane protein assembly factor BamB
MSADANKPETVLDCGGKRSATPLSHARGLSFFRLLLARPKAPSPLRSAGAVQDAGWLTYVSFIAAAFCLLVSGYLLFLHAGSAERDPWKAPQLLALKEKLRATPTDEATKTEIRRLDLEFRQRYVRRLSLNRTGGWLLGGGLVVLLLATKQLAKLRARPWLPQLRTDAASDARKLATQTRWAVAGIGAVVGVSLLTLALATTSPLPRSAAELDKLLGKGGATAVAASLPTVAEFQANWPQFRGFGGSGVVMEPKIFVASNAVVLWKTPIPAPGFNSPVVWSNRVFLSGGTAAKREVFCFDATTGQLLWQRAVANVPGSPATVPEIPEMTGYAASTMATDGQRAFVIFPNGDLAAFNFDGSQAWAKYLGTPKNMYGYASSLAIWPGKLIVQWDQDEGAPGGSKLFAFDCATGKAVWEKSKPTHGSWASPIVVEAAGKQQIITLALPLVMSHALADGSELWRAELMGGEVAPSAMLAGGLVFAVVPSSDLIALRPDGAGAVTNSHVAWQGTDNIPDITSPVGNSELVFTITSMGGLAAYETAGGKLVWQKDLEFEVQASPTIAGGQLILLGTKGELVTLQVGREFRELHRTKLDDAFHASPAFVGGRMFLRGATNLWCLGEKK